MALNKSIGHQGLDLLNKLLSLNPNTRISAEAALQHPFFNLYRPNMEVKEPLLYSYKIGENLWSHEYLQAQLDFLRSQEALFDMKSKKEHKNEEIST